MSRAKPDKYDATYFIGNTTVHVVAPQITEQEKKRRLDEIQKINWVIWDQQKRTTLNNL